MLFTLLRDLTLMLARTNNDKMRATSEHYARKVNIIVILYLPGISSVPMKHISSTSEDVSYLLRILSVSMMHIRFIGENMRYSCPNRLMLTLFPEIDAR